MKKNKSKNITIAIIVGLLLIAAIYFLRPLDPLEIKTELISQQLTNSMPITFFKTIETEADDLTIYILGNKRYEDIGYAHFERINKGYSLLHLTPADDRTIEAKDITRFYFKSIHNGHGPIESKLEKTIILLSNNPGLRKIELTRSNGEIENFEIEQAPSATYIEYFQGEEEGTYKFYDLKGELIP